MEKLLYSKEHFNIGKWSGGVTEEFAIYPENARYLERDFIWRLSSASVDLEESSFTRLPDYDRILLVLEGEAVLVHGEERSVKLAAMEQDSFDGGIKTKCFGKIRDYNLMYRKGCSGALTVMDVSGDAKPVPQRDAGDFSHCSYGVFCHTGYVAVTVAGELHMVKEGQQLIVNRSCDENARITVMGEGTAVFAEIFYNRASHVAEEIPAEKVGADDFKQAFKLVFTRNKWTQAMRKKNDVWHDEALQQALRKLEKSYILLLIWAVGMVAAIAVGLRHFSEIQVLGVAVIWTLLFFMLITPLIYMIVLPKPIKAHIKDVDKLTDYERTLYLRQAGENEMLDKMLKKYKNSGKMNGNGGEDS